MNEYEKESFDTIGNLPVYNESDNSLERTIAYIENRYRQGTLAYMEALHRYSMEIEKIRSQIDSNIKEKESEERSYSDLQNDIVYEERLLGRLNAQFCTKAESVNELRHEYKTILDKREYKRILGRKKRELMDLQDEIEELEATLLGKELERLNLLELLEPKRAAIEALRLKLKELELEKEYFENTKLHHIPQIAAGHSTQKQEEDREFIDTTATTDD